MRHEEVSQILLSPQFAHDLGDGQFGKPSLGLQTQRQEIGEHFDQQSGVQTVALEVHRADLENRFHDLPETGVIALFPATRTGNGKRRLLRRGTFGEMVETYALTPTRSPSMIHPTPTKTLLTTGAFGDSYVP